MVGINAAKLTAHDPGGLGSGAGWQGLGYSYSPRYHAAEVDAAIVAHDTAPRAVDVWHFVVGYLREIQANLRESGAENRDSSGKYLRNA